MQAWVLGCVVVQLVRHLTVTVCRRFTALLQVGDCDVRCASVRKQRCHCVGVHVVGGNARRTKLPAACPARVFVRGGAQPLDTALLPRCLLATTC